MADHITEDFNGGCNIAAKGGVLVESTKATWLHAFGVEHWWRYSSLIYATPITSWSRCCSRETNYDQGSNVVQIPPAPWVANVSSWGDARFLVSANGADKRCRIGFCQLYPRRHRISTPTPRHLGLSSAVLTTRAAVVPSSAKVRRKTTFTAPTSPERIWLTYMILKQHSCIG